jgi:membrane-associated phospholipid phosphatase
MALNGVLYYGMGALSGPATILDESFLDRWIVLTPWALIPYLSFFVLILLSFFHAPAERVPPLAKGIVASSAIAAMVFLLYPTTLRFPPVAEGHVLTEMSVLLRMLDTSKNCLPSLHGAITFLCIAALAPALGRIQGLLLLGWGAIICWSAIALRQHLVLDITAGVLLGAFVWAFFRQTAEKSRFSRRELSC